VKVIRERQQRCRIKWTRFSLLSRDSASSERAEMIESSRHQASSSRACSAKSQSLSILDNMNLVTSDSLDAVGIISLSIIPGQASTHFPMELPSLWDTR